MSTLIDFDVRDSDSLDWQMDNAAYQYVSDDMNLSVSWYLMAHYSVHVDGITILSDNAMKRLLRIINENRKTLTHHHLDLIQNDGTVSQYPAKLKWAVLNMQQNVRT